MRPLPLVLILCVAAALGLGVTYRTVTLGRGLDVVHMGPWDGWPRAGTRQADPYARAVMARSGEVPLQLADGLLFLASRDSAGAPLDGRCDIRILGTLPRGQLWTITLTDTQGNLIPNPAERHGFTSSEVVYRDDGQIDIVLSPRARAGNWLPTGARARVQVALRLYDTPFSFSSKEKQDADMPRILTEHCP